MLLGGLVAGCGGEPTADPTRWDLSDQLPGATRVREVPQFIDIYGAKACSMIGDLRAVSDTISGYGPPRNQLEFGQYETADLQIQYFVAWTNLKIYETGQAASEKLYEGIEWCKNDLRSAEIQDFLGYHTFEVIGSPAEGRYGWYESTKKPVGWKLRDTGLVTENDKEMKTPQTTPRQAIGLYTLVDDWILISVEVSTDNTDTDLRESFDTDALLDELAAKVNADPITKYDYEHRWDPKD